MNFLRWFMERKDMFNKANTRIAITYILLQVMIWIKCGVFFIIYGAGRVAKFNAFLFPADVILVNYIFHEVLHITIAICALMFAKNLTKIEWGKLAVALFVAVVLHNIAYWFTNTHSSFVYSIYDFASDTIMLLAFVLVGYVLYKTWQSWLKEKHIR